MDIIFYGPLGTNIPKERVGGAETGCKRSVAILKENDYVVHVVEKPTLFYGIKKFAIEFIRRFNELKRLFHENPSAVFYLVGFYDRHIFFEYLLAKLAVKTGHKYIYEPKNGAMIWKYNEGNAIYKKLSDYIFKNASIVFCQGVEYKEFLIEHGFENAVYHPNYINETNLKKYTGDKSDIPTFAYVGRVTQSKRIETIIDIFHRFYDTYEKAILYVIGGCVDQEYEEKLKNQVSSLHLEDAVVFTGRLDFSQISEYLNMSHFFLFPSAERFEGHSNSLTEAMAFGLIPIASTIGFNRSVIGDDSLLVDDYDPDKYAQIALRIWDKGEVTTVSNQIRKRAMDKFSEGKIRENYLNSIKRLEER